MKTRWAFVALAYLTLLAQSVLDNARGPAYPDILKTFDITASRGAYLFAWASFAGLLANLSARYWLPRLKLLKTTILALILMMLGTTLFGLSTKIHLWLLDFASIFVGFSMGMANVSMNLLIAQGTDVVRRRQFYSGLHAVYGFGSLMTPVLLNFYLGFGHHWDSFFIVLAVLPLIPLILATAKREEFSQSKAPDQMSSVLSAPTSALMRLLYGGVFGFYVASEIIVSTRLVLYLNVAHGIELENARLTLSIFFLLLLCGRFLFAILPIKGASQPWLLVSCSATIMTYVLARWHSPYWLALTGFTMSYFYPVAMDWLTKKFPHGIEWMTASVLTSISVMLVIMHLGFGQISDRFGIESAMAFVPIFQFVAFILLLKLGKAQR